jgi:hypothetical protein
LSLLSDFAIYTLNHGAWIWPAMAIWIWTDQHNYASECAKQFFLKKSTSPRVLDVRVVQNSEIFLVEHCCKYEFQIYSIITDSQNPMALQCFQNKWKFWFKTGCLRDPFYGKFNSRVCEYCSYFAGPFLDYIWIKV